MIVRALSLAAIAGALAFATAGCEKLDAALAPEPTIITQEATVAVPAAQVIGVVAEGAPEGLPLWPGARVEGSEATRGTFTLVLVASDTFEDVVNGVGVGLQRAGWEVAEEASGTEGERVTVLTVARAGASGFVTLAEGADGTTIEYVIEPAP